MHNSRAQAEVLGLLVIVIILIFIGVIYLRFTLATEAAPYSSVRTSIEASNLLFALMDVNIGAFSIREDISSCTETPSTCITLQNNIEDIFYSVLQEEENYRLKIITEDETVIIDMGDCTRGIVSTYPFTQEGVFYEAALTLC